jgi:PAS domain S-box-containing protein
VKIRWGIRGKLIASMMATLVPLLALSLFWSYRELQAERGKIELETLRFATSGATIADEFVTTVDQVLMTLAETPMVKRKIGWLLDPLVKDIKLKSPNFLNLVVVDEAGGLLASAVDPPRGRQVSYADREWFQEVSRTRRPVTSELITGRLTGLKHVVLAAPVFDRSDRFIGAIAAPIDLQGLLKAFGRLMLPNDATVILLDRRGTVLLRVPPEPDWVGRRIADLPLFREVIGKDHGVVSGPSLDRTEQLNAFASATKAPWSILVSIPTARAQAGFMRQVKQAGALIAAALAIAFIVGTLLSRRIAEPVRRLAKGARAIGEGQLDARIERASSDEIGELTEGFNRMAERLQVAHATVMESKTYLEQVIESSHDGIITVNPDLTIRTWSRGAEQILGWAKEEVIGRVAPFVPAEKWEEARAKVAYTMERRETVYYETVRHHRDGRAVDVSLTLSPLIGAHGEVIGAMAILRDITDRKQFERALQASEEKYRALFENANDPIFLIDPNDGAILDANRQAVATSGYSADELRAMRIFDVHPPEEREKAEGIIREIAEIGSIMSFEGTSLQTRDGRLIPLSVSASAAEFGGRRVIVGIARDITDLRRAEEERATIQRRLLQAEKLASLGQLAAGVAHEINNPLATIAGCAEGLLDRASDASLQAHPAFKDFPDYLAVIEEEAYRCKEITGGLLQFVRAEGGERQPTDINLLLSKSLEPTSHQPRFSGLKLQFDLAPDLPTLQTNQNRLRQVFLALAVNALEACGGKGQLTIRTIERASRSGGEIAIEFEDSGCGIPSELRERIFEPFFTTKGEHRGTGLGLAICRNIVADHGGQIECESEVGRGSLFRIRLPLSGKSA